MDTVADESAEESAEKSAVEASFHCCYPFKQHFRRHVKIAKKADVEVLSLRTDAASAALSTEEAVLQPFRVHAPVEI